MDASNIPKWPLARLKLMPPLPFSSVGSILEIREANAKTIQVFDPTDNPNQQVARYFDLATQRFVLRYTTESDRTGWTIEINSDHPPFSITYAFLNRNFASEFQKYVTGYDPGQYEVGENIQCDASIKRKWLPGCDRCNGIGEIQLWVPFSGSSDENGVGTAWEDSLLPRFAHQPNNTGTSSTFALVNEGRSPLIVMFLREIGTDRRTMLRMNGKLNHTASPWPPRAAWKLTMLDISTQGQLDIGTHGRHGDPRFQPPSPPGQRVQGSQMLGSKRGHQEVGRVRYGEEGPGPVQGH